MISLAQPVPVGNAVKVLLSPRGSTLLSRVLRKPVDVWTNQDDTSAAVAYQGDDTYFIDTLSLTNATTYYYKHFEYDGAAWTTSASVSATPAATLGAEGADPLSLVRDRLEAGLRVEVAAGALQHDYGYIPVLTAPPIFDETKFPIVTVHLKDDSPAMRGLGEALIVPVYNAIDDEWTDSEGWLANVELTIMAWIVGNPDTRIAVRKAIKKVLMGNLPVFDDAGMIQVSFSATDLEDFTSYNSPVYQTMINFNCLAPSIVASDPGDSASDITIIGSNYQDAA